MKEFDKSHLVSFCFLLVHGPATLFHFRHHLRHNYKNIYFSITMISIGIRHHTLKWRVCMSGVFAWFGWSKPGKGEFDCTANSNA